MVKRPLNDRKKLPAIAHSPRLEDILEGRVVRDALGLNAERARCNLSDLRATEAATGAGVMHQRRIRRLADDDSRARLAATPKDGDILLFAVSVADNRNAATVPAGVLYD